MINRWWAWKTLPLFLAGIALFAQSPAGSGSASPNSAPPAIKSNLPGGIEILSDTQGVDFKPYIEQWHRITELAWAPLIPDEVNPPRLKKGTVLIRFKIQSDGKLGPSSMILEGRSGDTALDRAAWFAITSSKYPPLPSAFHGPFIEVRALFLYNTKPNSHQAGLDQK